MLSDAEVLEVGKRALALNSAYSKYSFRSNDGLLEHLFYIYTVLPDGIRASMGLSIYASSEVAVARLVLHYAQQLKEEIERRTQDSVF